jgi:hypothetical protein
MLAEGSRGFPQLLQANVDRVRRIGHGQFLPNPFELTIPQPLLVERATGNGRN